MTAPKIKLLLIGLSESITRLVGQLMGDVECRSLRTAEDLSSFMDDPSSGQFQIAIAGAAMEGVSTVEIAQSIRAVMVEAPILFCHDSRKEDFDRGAFIKNGFTEAFLLPFETETFRNVIDEIVSKIRQTRIYKAVKIVDIQPGIALDFDLHILLSQNRKYIRYSSAGDPIDAERVEKLKACGMGSAYVPADQMTRFYDYSAKVLKSLSSPGSSVFSETERKARLQMAVRDLMTGIFTTGATGFEDGKQMMTDAGKIVETFVSQTAVGDWYSNVMRTLSDASDSYSHLSSVSAIAALFSMGLGIGFPEDFAIAGLFHDLGLALVPAEIQSKPESTWTQAEKEQYQKHPELALSMMKEKRIVVANQVQTLILQHHERHTGRGFPNGLKGARLKPESQVLGLADEFEYLTRVAPGSPRLSPQEAVRRIYESGNFNPELTQKLKNLFTGPSHAQEDQQRKVKAS